MTSPVTESEDFMFFTKDSENSNQYTLTRNVQGYPGTLGSGDTLFITVLPDYFTYQLDSHGGEGGTTQDGIILPTDEPDPRINLSNRACEGLPLSLITIGVEVTGRRFRLKTTPDMQGNFIEVGTPPLFTVTDGPICNDGFIWWYVIHSDGEGWLNENNDNWYTVLPYSFYEEPRPTIAEILGLDSN